MNYREKGVTFIEILVSIVIFATAITAMLQGLIFGNRRIKAATYRTSAIILAQERIEEMKNDTYANITESNYPDDNPVLDENRGIVCNRDVTIDEETDEEEDEEDDEETNYKTITVTVSYTYSGRQYQESITTIISP